MRTYLQTAPWWVISLVIGVLFGGILTVSVLIGRPANNPVGVIIIGSVVTGGLLGPIMAFFRDRRGPSVPVGDLSTQDAKAAARAAIRGPVPVADDVRRAAARSAADQLEEMVRLRWFGRIVFGFCAVFATFEAVTSSPRFWGHAAFFAAMLALQFWWPRHLQRRIDLLTADADA